VQELEHQHPVERDVASATHLPERTAADDAQVDVPPRERHAIGPARVRGARVVVVADEDRRELGAWLALANAHAAQRIAPIGLGGDGHRARTIDAISVAGERSVRTRAPDAAPLERAMTPEKHRPASDSLHATAIETRDTASPERRVLHVLGAVMKTYELSEGRTLVLGRSSGADLVVDTPSISRTHAALHVGKTLQLEDLGSANGTTLRGVALAPGTRVDVFPGDEIVLGKIPCVVQGRSRLAPAVPLRTLRTHEYFEARLADECARGEPFAVARVRAAGAVDAAFEAALLAALGPTEVAAWYGPGDYELLLPGATDASARLAALAAPLGEAGAPGERGLLPPRRPHARRAHRGRGRRAPRRRREARGPAGDLVVEDPAMLSLHRLLGRVAAADVPVLLLGEMGTGKEVFAAQLHQRSPRAAGPFRAINCAAFTDTLVEAELFGYEKGAFTGATTARPGLLESAAGGTVFLDEVGELAPTVQAKLLRAIEERKVRRVGAVDERPIDVRFIAATNRDLERAVESGGFPWRPLLSAQRLLVADPAAARARRRDHPPRDAVLDDRR
jgi:two-component system response regulator AtoC